MDYMQIAIEESKKSEKDVPVGAVIVKDGKIISKAHNTKEVENDSTAHAEINALRIAQKFLKTWHLDDCEMYVTLEPCPMCAWAIMQSRIKTVYFGSYDAKYGGFSTKIDLKAVSEYKPEVYGGIMESECDEILKEFFSKLR